MRWSLCLLLLPLPGCLTSALWNLELGSTATVEVRDAQFEVDTAGVAAATERESQPELLLQTHRVGGQLVASLAAAVPERPWFELMPLQEGETSRLEQWLRDAPLGLVDRCDLELQWQASAPPSQQWSARLRLGGMLAGGLRRSAGGGELADLVGDAVTVSAEAVATAELPACIAAAEHFDWRLLLPEAVTGRGRVEALLRSAAAAAAPEPPRLADLDLLIALEPLPPHRYLRVPAVAVAALLAARLGPQVGEGRFEVESQWRPRIVPGPAGPLRPLTLPLHRRLQLRTAIRRESASGAELLGRILLTPLAVVADATLVGVVVWAALQSDDEVCR